MNSEKVKVCDGNEASQTCFLCKNKEKSVVILFGLNNLSKRVKSDEKKEIRRIIIQKQRNKNTNMQSAIWLISQLKKKVVVKFDINIEKN